MHCLYNQGKKNCCSLPLGIINLRRLWASVENPLRLYVGNILRLTRGEEVGLELELALEMGAGAGAGAGAGTGTGTRELEFENWNWNWNWN